MAVEGSLDLFQLPEILQIIAQEQKTGILTVQGEADIVAVSFLRGEVVAADALNQTIEDGLGEVLLEQEKLLREDLEAAIAEQRKAGGRLIDLLVGKGGLARADLLDALRVLTYRLLEDLLSWNSGEFKFYTGDEVSYEQGFVPIGIEDLLLRSLPIDDSEAEPDFDALEPLELPEPETEPEPPVIEMPAPDLEPTELAEPSPQAAPPVSEAAPVPAAERLPARSKDREVRRPREAMPQPGAAPPRTAADAWGGLVATLALLAALFLAATAIGRPVELLYPFPPVSPLQEVFEASRWQARYYEFDRAVRTFHLLEGRLPADLRELVAIGLLAPNRLTGPDGRSLVLHEDGDSYDIRSLTADEGGYSDSIHGDFLLDNSFSPIRDRNQSVPLVLLD